MNPFLAELYNTAENIGADTSTSEVEKLAQVELLDQVLANEGISVDDLSGEDILKVAHEIFGPGNEIEKIAMSEGESEEEEDEEEDDEEKVAEADFLGRLMAHAYVDEMASLEKEASVKEKALKALGGAAETVGSKLTPGSLSARAAKAGKSSLLKKMRDKGMSIGEINKKLRSKSGMRASLSAQGGRVSKLHKQVGGAAMGAGALGVAGGGAYAASRGKKKESSALDALAEQRALEILEENGHGQNKLASAVEQRAWELLAENGYLE